MLYIEMKAALADYYRKYTKTLSGVNIQSLKIKTNGTYNYRYALKTLLTFWTFTVIFPGHWLYCFLQYNQLDALISQIYFWNKTLHVSDSSSVHHQEFYTVHSWQVAGKPSANLYGIYHCCVYSEKLLMMDRRNVRNMQNFYSKNKFEKLVHLVGFIIRIYHDARSRERHSHLLYLIKLWVIHRNKSTSI